MGNDGAKVKPKKDFIIMQKARPCSQRSQLRDSIPGYDQGYQSIAMASGGIVGGRMPCYRLFSSAIRITPTSG